MLFGNKFANLKFKPTNVQQTYYREIVFTVSKYVRTWSRYIRILSDPICMYFCGVNTFKIRLIALAQEGAGLNLLCSGGSVQRSLKTLVAPRKE